ncbi:MAG: NADAR family protein [Trebonia sp.]
MSVTVSEVRSVDQLIEFIADGGQPKYLTLWGHRPPPLGGVGKGCLSQWWPVTFTVDGEKYASAEHFMMAAKALLFGDTEMAERIRNASHPRAAKALGRQVRGFDEQRWAERRFDLVVSGNLAKFGQHPELRDFLLATGSRVLVEASPYDRIWGIGLAADHEHATSAENWPGLNLLGFALMEVRRWLHGELGR